jgi:hypothetical protein
MLNGRHGTCEQSTIYEAVRVDDRPNAGWGGTNRAEVNAELPANQEIGGARAKPVLLHQLQSWAQASAVPSGSLVVRVA